MAPCCAPARDRDDFGVVVPGATRFADVWNNDLFKASRAAFSSKAAAALETLETICTKCPYPTFLQHLYSVHDAQVIAQFAEVFKDGDPLLRQAFDLLSRARTGSSAGDLALRGSYASADQLFVGNENEQDTTEFVTFFGKTLLNEPSPINL